MIKRKRDTTKIGDIFSVSINDNEVRCFQLIAFDLSQLNSDVIRAFKGTFTKDEKVDIDQLLTRSIDFYAHCVTKTGLEFGFWEKIGFSQDIGSLKNIMFRDTDDDPKCGISYNWWTWEINQSAQYVGELKGENRKAELGLVFSPPRIVHRLKTGAYDMIYPGY